jgi:hypothetical protein
MKRIVASLLLMLLLLPMIPTAFAWEMERPKSTVSIPERVDNCTISADGMAAAGLGVNIHRYDENHSGYGGNDVIWLNISMTGNARAGITYGIDYNYPFLWFNVTDPTNIIGDDVGGWIELPTSVYSILFFGAI